MEDELVENSETEYFDRVMRGQNRVALELFALFSAAVLVLGAALWWRAAVSDERDTIRRETQECFMMRTEEFQRSVSEVLVVSIDPTSADQLTPENRERLLKALDGLNKYAESDLTIECAKD